MATSSKKATAADPPPVDVKDTTPADAPFVEVVMTCPMVVDLRAVAPGDHVTTDPDTAAQLIAAGYAVPTDDQEVS